MRIFCEKRRKFTKTHTVRGGKKLMARICWQIENEVKIFSTPTHIIFH
jgi:hypothetical protein